MTKPFLWWSAFGSYATLVLIVSVIPVPEVGPQVPSLDKIAHLLEYFLFSWLLLHAQVAAGHPRGRAARIAVVAAVIYGGLCEVLQAWLPYRDAEGWDVVANSIGGWLGVRMVSEPRHSRGESNHG